MKMAGITVLVNIAFSLMLFPVFRHVGVAAATSVAAWVNVILLGLGLRGFWNMDARLKKRLPRLVLASALMGAVIVLVQWAIGDALSASPLLRAIRLGLLISIGSASYAAWVLALGVTSIAEFRRGFRR